MTMGDFQGHSSITNVFKHDFSYSCASLYKTSTDIACRRSSAVADRAFCKKCDKNSWQDWGAYGPLSQCILVISTYTPINKRLSLPQRDRATPVIWNLVSCCIISTSVWKMAFEKAVVTLTKTKNNCKSKLT